MTPREINKIEAAQTSMDKMNTNPSPENDTLARRHTAERIASLAAFPVVAIGGWFIHVCVLPLPIDTLLAGIARYAYFLLWLGALLFLFGTMLFGYESRDWLVIVYALLGLFFGTCDGLMFAGHLGMAVGAFSGLLVGPVTFHAMKQTRQERPVGC